MEFLLTRPVREKYKYDQALFSNTGKISLADISSVRQFVYKVNQNNSQITHSDKSIKTSQLFSVGLINEVFHYIFSLYRIEKNPETLKVILISLQNEFGVATLDGLFESFIQHYPPLEVYKQKIPATQYLFRIPLAFSELSIRELLLEDLILLWISTRNPALEPFAEIIWDADFLSNSMFEAVITHVEKKFAAMPYFGPENQTLIEMLRSPARIFPNSITSQLEYIRKYWGFLLGDYLSILLTSLDLAKEEEKLGFMGPGPVLIPVFDRKELTEIAGYEDEPEAFSKDRDWMPKLVLIAKNIFVWLDQLSRQYNYPITRLDQIPDEELKILRSRGISGLWLIGLWQRSPASARIKQLSGNTEAVSSAYSLFNYQIAEILGGDEACERFREKAARFGIRLASDMVPNHMGIDSEWVIQHPEWFLSVDECPFPSYSFTGPDLSSDANILIQIEDHYYDRTDAAVVFRRVDKRNGLTKFIYHGNDGTSMPWNDTAQLNYLNPLVREEVIKTILNVARKFPIIRFDAAMTLTKKHIQRLWFPEPGSGGAIPSRSLFTLSKSEFNRLMPKEFWREVVEHVEVEVPDTLLLAEAFWMMEGFFVRTLGMHRVYNSAFMHMLRDEDNIGYRTLIKKTIEFEPEILKRYVNFMNNPDERTAIEQFGSGDKYFGVCTLMSTLPGLPMFGHGQIEGFTEKYGMEYSRAFYDEQVNNNLIQHHQSAIFPLLYRRELFAGVDQFRMYDFIVGNNQPNENVFVFTNQLGDQKALIIYNNNFQETKGKITHSIPQSDGKNSAKKKNSQTIGSVLGLNGNSTGYLQFYDISTRLTFIRPIREITRNGFEIHLNGYEHHVFVDFIVVHSDTIRNYDQLYSEIGHGGVSNIDHTLDEIRLKPVLHPLGKIINADSIDHILEIAMRGGNSSEAINVIGDQVRAFLHRVNEFTKSNSDTLKLQSEIGRLINALVQFFQLDRQFASPGMQKNEKHLKRLITDFLQNKSRWYMLFSWAVTSRIGKLASSTSYIETSLAWMDELRLNQPLAATLRVKGIPEDGIHKSLLLVFLSTELQDWYQKNSKKRATEILQGWFSSSAAQTFLKFNRFDNKLWYDHEAFQEFLWWMEIVAILQVQSEPTSNRVSLAETVLGVQDIMKNIIFLDKKSNCQVERILQNDSKNSPIKPISNK